MPQLGETVTEGTVTRWLKQVGDQVAPDELIFEVSTDKVDSEVPAPAGGGMLLSPVVRRLVAEHHLDPAQIPGTGEGGRVTRSDVLAYIDRQGGATRQAPSAPAAGPPSGAPPAAPARPAAPAAAPAPAAPAAAVAAPGPVA